jgi:dTDP-4-dehydrorhamnose 3,5-epimerase-like enzyme
LSFINGFPVEHFKRFYAVENHSSNFIRAWHGHLIESKALVVLRGSILACAVELDDKTTPNKSNEVTRVVLSAANPGAFFVPAGFANGFMTLTDDALVFIFSSTTIEESQGDDYRFEFDYWNPWEIVPR